MIASPDLWAQRGRNKRHELVAISETRPNEGRWLRWVTLHTFRPRKCKRSLIQCEGGNVR
uniref:Uncharacterized protein n=1 Tax=Anguilla anguilla TaxID=7936 RepID=A0A0E9SSW4_ANGAN